MLDDQRYILEQVLSLLDARPVDGVLLAGDLYDKPVPPAEAVRLLDWFLTELAARELPVFAVSGNHDSADRIAFGAQLLAGSRVYVSPVFAAPPAPITLTDEYGPVDVWLLPFLKPAAVRHVFPDEKIESYNDAIGCVLNACTPDPARRNVLVAHQFVAGAAVCESEEPSVGGVDSIDVSLFEGFDYVALGHLHSPQKVGRDTVRYAGSPLKYSFSEAHQHKAALFVTLGEKGSVRFETAPLTPRHDLRELRGNYMELTDRRAYDGTPTDDYLHITLTDEQDVPDALARLRVIYRTSCGWTTTTAAPGPLRRPTPPPGPRAKRPSSTLRPFTKPRTASPSPTNRRCSANRSSRTSGRRTKHEAPETDPVGLRALRRRDRSGPRPAGQRRALPRHRRHRRGQDHPLRRHHLRLYDHSSGGVREGAMLRSKYAEPGTPTFVELEFEVRGQRCTVRRNPEYLRPKARGEASPLKKPTPASPTLTAARPSPGPRTSPPPWWTSSGWITTSSPRSP